MKNFIACLIAVIFVLSASLGYGAERGTGVRARHSAHRKHSHKKHRRHGHQRHRKQIKHSSKKRTFTVNDETHNLSEVAIYLYGKPSMYLKIAKWNGIKAPFSIYKGKRLILQQSPTLTTVQGEAKLLAYWRKKFNLDGEVAVAHQPPAVAPVPVIEASIVEKTVPAPITSGPAPTKTYSATDANETLEPTLEQRSPAQVVEAPMTAPAAAVLENTPENPVTVAVPEDPAMTAPVVPEPAPVSAAIPAGALSRSEELFAKATTLLEEKNPEQALIVLKESYDSDRTHIASCILMIRVLRELKRTEEESTLTTTFLGEHPEYKDISFFRSNPTQP